MNRPPRLAFRRSGRITVLLLCCAAAPAALAVNWDQALPSSASAAAQAVDVAVVPGARWLLLQRNGTAVLQRESAGQITFTTTTSATARLIAMPDGGVLLVETDPGQMRRFDAQGQFVWERRVSPLLVRADAAGGSWIETQDDIQRIAADGSLRATLTANNFPVVRRTVGVETPALRFQRPQRDVDAQSGDLLVAGRSSVVSAQGRAQLARFDRRGSQRWTWTDNSPQPGIEFSAVAVGPNGSSCAAARQPGGSGVVRLCLDAAGQQRWLVTQELGPNSATAVVAVGNDGSLYALDTVNRTGAQLARVAANGTPLWTQPLPAGIGDACAAPGPGCSLQIDANGDATVLTSALSGAAQRLRLIGYSASGTLRYDRELPVSTVVTLARDNNGHFLAIGAREAGVSRLFELDAQGQLIDDDIDLQTPLREETRTLAANSNGDTFVVSSVDGAASYRVSRIGADGALVWNREYPGAFDLALATASSDRVCIAEIEAVQGEPDNRIRCLAAADGGTLWARTIQEPLNFRSRAPLPPSVFRLRADNVMVLSFLYDGVRLLNPDGTSLRQYPTDERTPLGDFNNTGDSVVVERLATTPPTGDEGKLIQRSNTGRVVYTLDLAATGIQPLRLRIDDNDNVYIVGKETESSSELYVWMLDGDANVRWRRPLEAIANTTLFLHLTDDSLVVERRFGTPLVNARVAIEVLRRDGGNRRWRKTLEGDQIDFDASTQRVVVLGAGQGRWDVHSYSLENGAELSAATLACPAQDCSLGGAAAQGGVARFAALDHAAARSYVPGPDIRVDQSGINGAWGSYYGEGEGLVLDWLPQARLIFMPWFTYSREGGNETAQQRWYVAQAANVPAGALAADIEIYLVTGGAFDSAEPRLTTRVGSGTLRFSDCANGRFSYVFDPRHNGGAKGTITLSRLSPATQPCQLADGSVQAAPGARPASKGFDQRQSGSWYEPATGGQGMQLTVQPDGVFFAAWFAYDVAGAADDNGKQHWFTLQGNLAQSVDGKIDLVIVQTVGGAFDRSATRNRYVAGQATLQMNGCDRATLTYRFNDDERVGAFAGRTGDLAMIKEGGCGP